MIRDGGHASCPCRRRRRGVVPTRRDRPCRQSRELVSLTFHLSNNNNNNKSSICLRLCVLLLRVDPSIQQPQRTRPKTGEVYDTWWRSRVSGTVTVRLRS
jgi:hypothetical protein